MTTLPESQAPEDAVSKSIQSTERSPGFLPLLANLAAQTIFGFSIVFVRMGTPYVDKDAVRFLSYRFGTGLIVMTLLILFGLKKVHYRTPKVLLIFLCGLFNPLISQVAETMAMMQVPASLIAMYTSVIPVVMLLFGVIINHEYPTKRQMIFVFITALGVLVANLKENVDTRITAAGLVLVILAILGMSASRVLVRRASVYFSSFEIVYITTAMGAAAFNVYSVSKYSRLYAEKGLPFSTYFQPFTEGRFLASVLYLGIVSAVIAFLLMSYAAAHLSIAAYSASCAFNTVVGILVGVFLFRETLVPLQILGAVIILAGVTGSAKK